MQISKTIDLKNNKRKILSVLSTSFASIALAGCSSLSTVTNQNEALLPSTHDVIKIKEKKVSDGIDTININSSQRYEKTLKNGLRIIVKEDHRSPVVMTQVWYKVGAVDEDTGKGGVSHLLEHMMFKGTDKVKGKDFDRIVNRFGGSQNAMTSADYTTYYQFYPAHRMSLALELEADRMINLNLREEDFVSERQVVMEERRQNVDDKPKSKAYEEFLYQVYAKSNQRNPVIGSMQDIESLTLTDLRQWYKKWYAPNNATIVIVGDVKAELAFKEVEKYFAHLPASTLPKRVSLVESRNKGQKTYTAKLAVNLPSFYMAYNVPSLFTPSKKPVLQQAELQKSDNSTQDAYALALLSSVLDGGMSSRLERRLVRDKKVLAGVSVDYTFFSRGDSLFFIEATPQQGVTLEDAQQAILKEIEELKTQPITQQEIQRMKTSFLASLVYQQDSISSQADMIGEMAIVGLDDSLVSQMPQKMANISENKLHAVAKKYLNTNNLTTLKILPAQEK